MRGSWWHRIALVVRVAVVSSLFAATGPFPRLARLRLVPSSFAGFSGSGVSAYGDAPSLGGFAGTSLAAPPVAMAPTPSGNGYWVVAADGGVFAFGDAGFYGSMGGSNLYAPVMGMAATPDGRGYWMVAADGGVFGFGDAGFYGSMGAVHLNAPVVAMAATPDGRGYWMVASDGGVFSFGDAGFYGSMGGTPLGAPVVAMAATHDGRGYWIVGSDGGVFSFGDARFFGSAANHNIGTWVTGIAPTPDDGGYWLVAATAGVLTIGDAAFYGPSPNAPPFPPTSAIAATPDGKGYWLLQPDSINVSFGRPAPLADFAGGERAVQLAAAQIGPDPSAGAGPFCNPYGPCEEWCVLFATWVWQQAGIVIPQFSRVSDVFGWAGAHGVTLGAKQRPEPGDFVLYGTSPSAFVHVGIVAEVWPDGAITTIEGDSGPEPNGQFGVTFTGPFLPAYSSSFVGMPIYGFVRP